MQGKIIPDAGETPPIFLSLGAGVQSTTMFLMAAQGLITPRPTAAIFADTQDEPQAVYDHLEKLKAVGTKEGIPIHVVTAGKLSDNLIRRDFSQIPAYKDGSIGKRQCTVDYKIVPITREMRRLMGYKKGERIRGRAEQWIGISLDEVQRMKMNRTPWIKNRWPLVDLRMNRNDCIRWLGKNWDQPVPKSACLYCPFHSDSVWADLKKGPSKERDFIKGIDEKLGKRGEFLHRSQKPIDEVKFTDADRGQLSLFNNECEGVCGV